MAQRHMPKAVAPTPGVAIILAAGQGRPNPLAGIGGRPMLQRLISSAAPAFGRAIVVAGPNMPGIAAAAAPYPLVTQREQLGSAHAALQAAPMLSGFRGDAVVISADTPLLSRETLARLRDTRAEGAHLVLLTVRPAHPGQLPRVVACPDTGLVDRLVEWEDASQAERAIGLCHAGVFCARSVDLFRWLRAVRPHHGQGELCLSDIVAIARDEGRLVIAVQAPETEFGGMPAHEDATLAEVASQIATPRVAA
jgi:bifunctional UDP-N-acetylglucosamine pyrophosphorylase/glucosamine-1-phosphate N-acetyltransferase